MEFVDNQNKLFSAIGVSLPEVMHKLGDAIAVCDNDFRFKAANQRIANWYGLPVGDLIGKNVFDVYPQFQSSVFFEGAEQTVRHGLTTAKMGFSKNTSQWLMVRTCQLDNGLSVWAAQDLDFASLGFGQPIVHDSLTALKNRVSFEQDMQLIYERHKSEFGVVFIDICNFANINAEFGTVAGDKLLMEVAACLRSASALYNQVYRVGADQFALIFPKKRDACIYEIHRLRHALDRPFTLAIGARTIHIEVSIGFMFVDVFMHSFRYVIEETEFALSRAKSMLPSIYHEHILTM